MGNILVIDDEPNVRLLIRKMLESEGHTVIEASDGIEGVESYHKSPVDVIITDLIMPDKEGLETIHELKKEYPDIKIIAMSGTGNSDIHLGTAKLLGATAVLTKPFKKESLLVKIRELSPNEE